MDKLKEESLNSNEKKREYFENLVYYSLDYNPIQKELIKHPIFLKIIGGIRKTDLRVLKRAEMIFNYERPKDVEKIELSFKEEIFFISKIVQFAAKEAGSGLLCMNGKLYYYDKAKWVQFHENEATEFMSLAAHRIGWHQSFVGQIKNKTNLYNQLLSDCISPNDDKNMTNEELKVLINVQNGTLELDENFDFHLREHRAEDYLRYQLNYLYDPKATCPQFDKFLDEVLPEKEAQDVLMEMIGYCFIPTQKLKLERSLMLYGPGANGKGVVYDIVVEIIGEEHVSGFSMSALSYDANARAGLSDMLLNYATELGGKCNADMIKKLISGEPVDVKTLYKDKTMMKNYPCKFIFNTNDLPRGAENTHAFFRRWLILPFDVEIPKEKRDVHLSKKLKAELPGIFNRVLAGVKRLLINKDFTNSEFCNKMIDEYQQKTNSVYRFITEKGWLPSVDPRQSERISADASNSTQLKEFYNDYTKYCQNTGVNKNSYPDFRKKIRQYFYVQPNCTNNQTLVFVKNRSDIVDLKTKEPEFENPFDTIYKNKNEENESKSV